MALRVARGLFRLWLVLSVLWIGGVAVETWWTFRSMIGYLRRLRAGTIPNLGDQIRLRCSSVSISDWHRTSKELVIVPLGWDCEHVGQQLRLCARVP